MDAFEYESLPGRVVFGAGRRAQVPAECARLGARRVMLVASGSATAAADVLAEQLGEVCGLRWSEVAEHVPVDLAARARAAARDAGVDAVVCVGGGSAVGLAKAVVLEVDAPIVALPTTYAGSEMTALYGLTGAHKQTARDPRVRPRTVVYDVELTLDLPAATSVASAANALAHCVEGLYGPGANPVTDLAACEGIRVITAAVPGLGPAPRDVGVRSDLMYGAYLGGTVIASVGVGIHHRTCHVLGGTYGLGHGPVNAVILPHAIAYNAPAVPAALAAVARAMGSPDAAAAVHDLMAGAGLPVSLAALGLPESVLDEAAARIVAETTANPRAVDVASVRAMLDDAWHGTRPSVVAS